MEEQITFHLAHIGINQETPEAAQDVVEELCALFGFGCKSGSSSFFAGDGIEIMKSHYLGEKGHIAIGTNKIIEAMELLEKKGVRFLKETAKYDKDHQLKAIYLDGDIGGFAFHLLQL